jgi:hypothetical protein
MKAIVNFSKRTNWFKASIVLVTCLLFLIHPACEKLEPNQDPLSDMEMVATPRAASSSSIMYWGRRNFTNGGGDEWICTPYLEQFGNFVLKVQNVNGGASKISALEVRIDGLLILTARGLSKDYLVTKTLRSAFSNCAHLSVNMTGDQGCAIDVWIEGTLKLGKVYGRHFYYETRQALLWNQTTDYRWRFPGFPYPVIINDTRENNFVLQLTKNRYFFIGLSDLGHEQTWNWVDDTPCRSVDWNESECGWPNLECPGAPIPWGNTNCVTYTDSGFNNWDYGEPNNGGGGCNQQNHRDENVAIINWHDKWEDVPTEPGEWGDGNVNWDSAERNCVLEWNTIPSSDVIYGIFRQEYPEYSDQYPN